MNHDAYEKGLVKAWKDELFGEAVMGLLSRAIRKDPEHSIGLAEIARLERLMGEVLSRMLPDGIDRPLYIVEAQARARREAAKMSDYDSIVDRVDSGIEGARQEFLALAALAPPHHSEVMALLVDHEDALGAFFRMGRDQSAEVMRSVMSRLQNALAS